MAPALRSQCSFKKKRSSVIKMFFGEVTKDAEVTKREKKATTQMEPIWRTRGKREREKPTVQTFLCASGFASRVDVRTETETQEYAFWND